jgi:hypothetical protein
MPNISDLRQHNAHIQEQMVEWKQQRFANGENPIDWVAFRNHLEQLGAPDPGEHAPDEFYRWDESLVGGTPTTTPSDAAAYGKSGDISSDEMRKEIAP